MTGDSHGRVPESRTAMGRDASRTAEGLDECTTAEGVMNAGGRLRAV